MMKVMRDDGMLENHEIIAGDGRNKKDKDIHGVVQYSFSQTPQHYLKMCKKPSPNPI